jgi:hypothetical protein
VKVSGQLATGVPSRTTDSVCGPAEYYAGTSAREKQKRKDKYRSEFAAVVSGATVMHHKSLDRVACAQCGPDNSAGSRDKITQRIARIDRERHRLVDAERLDIAFQDGSGAVGSAYVSPFLGSSGTNTNPHTRNTGDSKWAAADMSILNQHV